MNELNKFDYEPPTGFEDSNAYPNTGGSESTTREQMMRPHKQIREYINNVVELLKGLFGASSIGTLSGKSIQEELNGRPTKKDVLLKGNTSVFDPTGDYEPATVKFVKDTAFDVNNADMRKDVYDKNENGRVDDSDKVNGFEVNRSVLDDEYTNIQIDNKLVAKLEETQFEVTFLASDWLSSASGKKFSQQINVEGMSESFWPNVALIKSDDEEIELLEDENNNIRDIYTHDGYVVGICYEKPLVDLKYKLIANHKATNNLKIVTGNTFELLINLKTDQLIDKVQFTLSDFEGNVIYFNKEFIGNDSNMYILTVTQQETLNFVRSYSYLTAKALISSTGSWQSVSSTDTNPILIKVIQGRNKKEVI